MNLVTIVGVVADHGSIIELDGYDQTDRHVHVYADRRPAEQLLEALLDTGEALAAVDDWQIRVVPPLRAPAQPPVPFTMVGALLPINGGYSSAEERRLLEPVHSAKVREPIDDFEVSL